MATAPTGPNIRDNPYYTGGNHIRLAPIDRDRTEFFGTIGGVPDGPPIEPDVAVPTQNFVLGVSLPHTVNLENFNAGGKIASITSDVGTVNGTKITFDDQITDAIVSWTATNETGSDAGTFQVVISSNLVAPDVTVPSQEFFVSVNLPHGVNFEAYNAGGALDSITTDYGSIVGVELFFPDVAVSRLVNWTATNATATDAGAFQLDVVTGVITATVAPTIENPFNDDYINTITGFAAMDNPANYTTNVPNATINPVEWQLQTNGTGDFFTQVPSAVMLTTGDVLRYRVTDSAGTELVQVIGTAEYRILAAAVGDYAEMDVNPNLPTSDDITISVDGDSVTTTYAACLAGPQTIADPVLAGTAVAGQILTIAPPKTVWAKDAGDGIGVEVWTTNATNAVNVSDPHAPTLEVHDADTGTITVTCTTTVNSVPVAATSNGLEIIVSTAWITPAWDDGTDTFTASFVSGDDARFAFYNDADGQPSVSNDGVWTGTTQHTVDLALSEGVNVFTPTYPANIVADRMLAVVTSTLGQNEAGPYVFTASES